MEDPDRHLVERRRDDRQHREEGATSQASATATAFALSPVLPSGGGEEYETNRKWG